jgi:hypothetical protein
MINYVLQHGNFRAVAAGHRGARWGRRSAVGQRVHRARRFVFREHRRRCPRYAMRSRRRWAI